MGMDVEIILTILQGSAHLVPLTNGNYKIFSILGKCVAR